MRILIIQTLAADGLSAKVKNLSSNLRRQLADSGHEIDVATLPFVESSPNLIDQIMGYRLLGLETMSDRVLAIDFPGGFVKHPNKHLFLGRGCMSLFEDVPRVRSFSQQKVLDRVRVAQTVAIKEACQIHCEDSETVQAVLKLVPVVEEKISTMEPTALLHRFSQAG